jgi:glycosyltransferase involved in cell wall biosynthesis
MKIAVFAHSCLLETNRAIYQRMSDAGHSVEIVVPSNYSIAPQASQTAVKILPTQRNGRGQRFYWYKGISSLLDAISPDCVILDLEPDSLLAVQLARWCSTHRRKLVIQTCENLTIAETTQGKSGPVRMVHQLLRKLFLTYTVPRTFCTLPISSKGGDLLASFGFTPNQIVRIPLGVNISQFRPSQEERDTTRAQWKVTPDMPVIAYIGRMVRQKGVHLLLEALTRLSDLPWKLAIDDFKIGNAELDQSDPYPAEIDKILALPAFENRVLRIHAAHHEIPAVMNGIDILVAPSTRVEGFWEQYGRVIPEALACGTPVIASDTGAFPEVGGDAAQYFKEGDNGDLTSVLRKAILLSPQDRMAEAPRRRAYAVESLSLEAQWKIMSQIIR